MRCAPDSVARVCMHDRALVVGPCHEPKGDVLIDVCVCADDGRTHFAARADQRSRGRQPRSNQKALPHVCGVAVTEARWRLVLMMCSFVCLFVQICKQHDADHRALPQNR